MTIPAFPLAWPTGWRRMESWRRKSANFKTQRRAVSVADGVARVRDELTRMCISDDDLVVSTNVALRLDGWPRSDQREPEDPGAAVYWTSKGATRCMAIDRYDGGAEILDRAFTGFTALPPPAHPWHVVLGVQPHTPTAEVRAAYMRRRSSTHPDNKGDPDAFVDVMAAWSTFCAERGVQDG